MWCPDCGTHMSIEDAQSIYTDDAKQLPVVTTQIEWCSKCRHYWLLVWKQLFPRPKLVHMEPISMEMSD